MAVEPSCPSTLTALAHFTPAEGEKEPILSQPISPLSAPPQGHAGALGLREEKHQEERTVSSKEATDTLPGFPACVRVGCP